MTKQVTKQKNATNKIALPILHVTCKYDVKLAEQVKLDDSPSGVTEGDLPNTSNNESVKDRYVTFTASDERSFARMDWYKWEKYNLILSHDPNHVRLDRVTNGVCMFLSDHDPDYDEQIGKIVDGKLKNKQLTLTALVNDEDLGNSYLSRVKLGTAPGNSVGVNIYTLEVVKKAVYDINPDTGYKTLTTPATMRAIDWELMECSAVGIPAIGVDPSAYSKQSANKTEMQYLHDVTVIGDPGYERMSEQLDRRIKELPVGKRGNMNKLTGERSMTSRNKNQYMNLSDMSEDQLINQVETLSEQLDTLQNEYGNLQGNLAKLEAKNEELQTIIDEEKHRGVMLSDYRTLLATANSLKQQGKLSVAQFEQRFSRTEEQYLSDIETDAHLFQKLTGYLEAASERKAMLSFDTQVKEQPAIKTEKLDSERASFDNDDSEDEFVTHDHGDVKPLRSY